MTKLNDWGTYDTDVKLQDGLLKEALTFVPPITDDLIAHECAHAIVAHRLGMPVIAIDMTGLLLNVPLTLVDETVVPDHDLAQVFGTFALAGPIGEALCTKCQPQWHQDGIVARAHARKLAGDDINEQMRLLETWKRHARSILTSDPAYRPLQTRVAAQHTLTREEFEEVVERADCAEADTSAHL